MCKSVLECIPQHISAQASCKLLILLNTTGLKLTGSMLWISIITYRFYTNYLYYQDGIQFGKLRNILGKGLCISRSSASVINLSCAFVLLPFCRKLNQLLFRLLSQTCPGVFFLWLENAKRFHMTVAATLVIFGVVHSVSHLVNLWSFTRYYDHGLKDINLATFKDQNPLLLLVSLPGVTGVSMLLITLLMAVTSLRPIRRTCFNVFWMTHQMHLVFLVLLIIHPLSGVLKEEIVHIKGDPGYECSFSLANGNNTDQQVTTFTPIKSKTWQWMALPLTCFLVDYIWRLFTRNRNRVYIIQVNQMSGRTIELTVSCPEDFLCKIGQYVLLQCPQISAIEWHPFTIVQLPKPSQRYFKVWIRVSGDWTEALEKILVEKEPGEISILADGPYCSALQAAAGGGVSVCVAAGVGVTPYVALLKDMADNPRSHKPGRVHLLWIVRHESELSWLAELATTTMINLRNANKPDRLHLELYVTNSHESAEFNDKLSQIVILDDRDRNKFVTKIIEEDEKLTLLTPYMKRNTHVRAKENEPKGPIYKDNNYNVADRYPLLGCRIRRGRPNWDRVFGYWLHLYPAHNLHLYCCGPKKLGKLLRNKCKIISHTTKTKFSFVQEGFS